LVGSCLADYAQFGALIGLYPPPGIFAGLAGRHARGGGSVPNGWGYGTAAIGRRGAPSGAGFLLVVVGRLISGVWISARARRHGA